MNLVSSSSHPHLLSLIVVGIVAPLVLLLVELLFLLFQDANLLLPFVAVIMHISLIFINLLNC